LDCVPPPVLEAAEGALDKVAGAVGRPLDSSATLAISISIPVAEAKAAMSFCGTTL
jgi:hypothetical protein